MLCPTRKVIMLRHPFVINIITKALLETEDDYMPESSEWPDGTRSDVVLAHKSADNDHPPIIVEFQQNVDEAFMRRAIGYCLQASRRFKSNPIMLIFGIRTVQVSLKETFKRCGDLPYYAAPCDYWAARCYVVDKYSIQNHIDKDNMDPFVALGLFFTSQAPALHLVPRSTDPTVIMLYRIFLDVHTKILDQHSESVNDLKGLHDTYCAQYEKILNLLKDEGTPKSDILQYVSQLAEHNSEQKRKFDELCEEGDDESYQQEAAHSERMKFVEDFKKNRAENRMAMSWELCFVEGKEKLNWQYKNANSLRAVYSRYEKRKE